MMVPMMEIVQVQAFEAILNLAQRFEDGIGDGVHETIQSVGPQQESG